MNLGDEIEKTKFQVYGNIRLKLINRFFFYIG